MNKLIVTVGLPRSGKSTWARAQGLPIVNLDAIRLALHGHAFLREAEPMVLAQAQYMVRSLFLAGCPTVIFDATNTTHARRQNYASKLWVQEFKVFDTPMEVCVERAIATDKPELIPVIQQMAATYEPLTDEELA